ncbi:PREDICTED: xylem serine proteinase 1-like isoform 1 [Fragaria vesca subsp. vesca]
MLRTASSVSVLLLTFAIAMADSSAPLNPASSASESAVHIVYTEKPQQNEEPEAYHIRTLASVLVRRLPRTLWFTVTRLLPVDSLPSSLLNRSPKSPVSPSLSLPLYLCYSDYDCRDFFFNMNKIQSIITKTKQL